MPMEGVLGAINLPNFVRCRFWSNTAFPHVYIEIIVPHFGSHRIPGRSVRSVKRMRTENECKTWHAHDSHGRWKCTEVTADRTHAVLHITCCGLAIYAQVTFGWVTGVWRDLYIYSRDGGRIWFSRDAHVLHHQKIFIKIYCRHSVVARRSAHDHK